MIDMAQRLVHTKEETQEFTELYSRLEKYEDISDRMEARRCLDILYGACVVSKCRLTRVSRDTLYIIAPADVKLAAFDGLRRMGEQDIQLNWPYPDNGGFTSSFGGVQANYRTVGGYQNAR